MDILYEVDEVPGKSFIKGKRKKTTILYTLNAFMESGMKYALVNSNAFPHANGNNLRRNIAELIKNHELENEICVTIRGNDVYLVRKGE